MSALLFMALMLVALVGAYKLGKRYGYEEAESDRFWRDRGEPTMREWEKSSVGCVGSKRGEA